MKRRRSVPSPERLESRELMASLFGNSTIFGTPSLNPNPALTLPNTPQQKSTRIARLPFYLKETQPSRILPKSVMEPIQDDLRAIEGKLQPPPHAVLNEFNRVIRKDTPQQTLTPATAGGLNHAFLAVLRAAGATPEALARFQTDMTTLALLDSKSPNPMILATNDFSIILQVALGVGRPIRTPAAPVLSPADQVGKNAHLTTNREPRLVGTYDPGATIDLLNASGVVIGTTTVARAGRYAVSPSFVLLTGVYTVSVQGVEDGFVSAPSPTYTFRVVSRGPRTPAHQATTRP
jgi:hypothetical protein